MGQIMGYRKLIGFVITLIVFMILKLVNSDIEVISLGTALGAIYAIYAGSNLATSFKKKETTNDNEPN
jgi:threonine/homoserine/homoserine lactone efflux protein